MHMALFDDYKKRLDQIIVAVDRGLDLKTRQNAAEDLAKYNFDLARDYKDHKLADDEWISLSVLSYNIRDGLLLLK
ncbi:MAG: hypothetical protein UW28_C0043G0002 [Parcubacteria group bacterium GW2011_GWA2_44_13]|nr:MAG: hypothetical protein UW28_C0043G0002 [Parcubacteria group bacterium GW2011_GWA2_44_13]